MNLERLKALEKLAQEDPGDPFNIYALALEYAAGGLPQADIHFDLLLTRHPDYIPAYYSAGNYFWGKGATEKARDILYAGLERSTAAGDLRTRNELRALLDLVED